MSDAFAIELSTAHPLRQAFRGTLDRSAAAVAALRAAGILPPDPSAPKPDPKPSLGPDPPQESIDYELGLTRDDAGYNFGLSAAQANWPDLRTLRLSRAVGFDVTPLIHFWGACPPAKPRACPRALSLSPTAAPPHPNSSTSGRTLEPSG